jgi:hypothetical protein
MRYDVFICHASEDKDDFVRPLAEMLKQQNISVWYDEFSLNVGDSLRQKIDDGLAQSSFGIVVLSPSFFRKPWTNRELNGLTSRELLERKEVILPIWHRVNLTDVAQYSPPLADKVAISSEKGINAVIRAIVKKIHPNHSPLVVAKEYLTDLGVETPPISDEWWLDMIEYKEMLRYPDINSNDRWIFPLPCRDDDRGYNRGLNIAAAALQSDWSFEGEELDIGPITHPDKVHAFLRRWPDLYSTARRHPEVLALYVPQIAIPGFDEGFEDVFNQFLISKERDWIGGYGKSFTTDGKDPLCPDVIALRHPRLGNYLIYDIARWYFNAHYRLSYSRKSISNFEGLIWLLSADAEWMPQKYRDILILGLTTTDLWFHDFPFSLDNSFLEMFYRQKRAKFTMTPKLTQELLILVVTSLNNLGINSNAEGIVQRLLETNFIANYFDYAKRFR